MKLDWFKVARDVLMVLVLSGVGVALVGWLAGGGGALVAWLLLTAGFCLSGVWAGDERSRHLPAVAAGVWLLGGGLHVFAAGGGLPGLLSGLLAVAVTALLGGLIAWLLARRESPAEAG